MTSRWSAELAYAAHAHLAEGPLWDARTGELLFVDIYQGIVHRVDPSTGADRPLDVGQPVSCVVPRACGGYALAVRDGFAVADDGRSELVAAIERDRPANRMNDGACDSRGRFWAGSMADPPEQAAGALYCLDRDGEARRMLGDVTISNGIAWSPDDRCMYYVDTPTGGIDVFDYDALSGRLSARRRLATIEDGAGQPDGLVVDADGCVWVALWDGWAVRRYGPDGALLGVVDVPVARVTKPAFGGVGLDDLYVTTAAPDTPDPAQPHAGGIFHVRPGPRGRPPHAYGG